MAKEGLVGFKRVKKGSAWFRMVQEGRVGRLKGARKSQKGPERELSEPRQFTSDEVTRGLISALEQEC